jgi:hypothetical protein
MSEIRSLVASLADHGQPRTEAMVRPMSPAAHRAPPSFKDQMVVLEEPVEGRPSMLRSATPSSRPERICVSARCSPMPRSNWPATSTRGDLQGARREVPEATCVVISGGRDELQPFTPDEPSRRRADRESTPPRSRRFARP